MRQQLQRHIGSKALFTNDDRLLLGISGGGDSVVLCHLLAALGYDLALAHCNYKLRGRDSDGDEEFCRKLAKRLDLKFYSKTFDLAKISEGSLQEKARALRYGWFESLRKEHGFHYILTAHHAGDQAETLLLNLLRGTGLKGMRGIAEKEKAIVRPLLPFTRDEILRYAKKERLKFRNDKSNTSEKYRRNVIRLRIMPLLRKINPSAETTLSENASRFAGEHELLSEQLALKAVMLSSAQAEQLSILIRSLLKEKAAESILHFILEPRGFNTSQVAKVLAHLRNKGLPGKKFLSPGHRLTIDREKIFVVSRSASTTKPVTMKSENELRESGVFRLDPVEGLGLPASNELILSREKLQWPLRLRGIKQGDRFMPFGMKGKKLLSDFLREQKLNAFEKEKVQVLENGNGDILWVIGLRSDERYRVHKNENGLIKITYSEQA